jgi:EF hand
MPFSSSTNMAPDHSVSGHGGSVASPGGGPQHDKRRRIFKMFHAGALSHSPQKATAVGADSGTASAPPKLNYTLATVAAAVARGDDPKSAAAAVPTLDFEKGDQPKQKWITKYLRRSKYFQRLCENAFVSIDTDQSGEVDEKELYAGLLLIHLQLGMYVGPSACKPLSRERVTAIFRQMDYDQSNSLTKSEFVEVMILLFSNVILRVLAQWSLTIIIVPLVAQSILDTIYMILHYIYAFVTSLDDRSKLLNSIEETITGLVVSILWTHGIAQFSLLKSAALFVFNIVRSIPEGVWNSIPLTILSTILGVIVVPYIILKIDDFFQYLAGAPQHHQHSGTAKHHHNHHHHHNATKAKPKRQ